jgi:transposase-like protein
MNSQPKTLLQAVTYFAVQANCIEFVKNLCWTNGTVECPRCGSQKVTLLSTRELWQCECRKQFSIKYNTIFEKSPLPLSKWLPCLWLIANAKNGISSHEISRSLGVTQKTAWFMLHRIREAMRTGTFTKLSGKVEVDETYVGGSAKNRHAWQKTGIRGGADKTVVMGGVERGGRVSAKVITTQKVSAMRQEVRNLVAEGSQLFTDELTAYKYMRSEYDHSVVNHSQGEYVNGEAHTNTIESFWALFKRTVKGTYIHIAPFHTDRYLDEQSMRFNWRKSNDFNRFEHVVSQIKGRRLTYAQLTGKLQ